MITEDWVELGLYLPWFPYNFEEYGPFTFDVDIATDSAYVVRGYGSAVSTKEGWHLERTFPTHDIVVVASNDLATRRVGDEGHLWWRSAETNTWEDWLNESFAEYSALLLLKDALGEDALQTRIDRKRNGSNATAPIWEFDRSDTATDEQQREVEAILYSKGPLLLHELSERVGQQAFLEWCRSLLSHNITTTDDALALLHDREGAVVSEWFEELLRER